MEPRLVLFDIDHTLIDSAGCGRRALQKALHEVLSIENALPEDFSMSGKTDTTIVFEVLEKNNMLQSLSPKKDLFLWERYVFHLQIELDASKKARISEGIPELLKALQAAPSTHLGLLTGNIQNGAKTKLEHFGLWSYFPTGGFGDDYLDRNRVAQVALSRCREHFNQEFSPAQVYVVGDSLRDIAAADAIHAKSLIVSSGMDSHEALSAKKPYSLFKNFKNTPAVLKALEGIPYFETRDSPQYAQ